MNIFLIGFMGSGKSTAGKKLATKLKMQFIDLDSIMELETNTTIHELFNARGENAFREIEHATLKKVVASTNNAVIATGGGTPCFFQNMDFMNANGVTVYLEMHPGSIYYRLARSKADRPLISGKTDAALMEYIIETLETREPVYLKAKHIVKGESLNIAGLAEKIIS